MTCATHHLAALAPSTKLCDYVAFFCSVIGAATTNLAADSFAKREPGVAKRIIGSSLTISCAPPPPSPLPAPGCSVRSRQVQLSF